MTENLTTETEQMDDDNQVAFCEGCDELTDDIDLDGLCPNCR